MRARGRAGGEAGQGTVEWVALIGFVSIACMALVAAGFTIPGVGLARSMASKLACAASISATCVGEEAVNELTNAYGEDLAGLVRKHAPSLLYEEGMHALPVDYRRCRSSTCGDGAGEGSVSESEAGEPVTLFTRVIDCRPGEADDTEAAGGDCSGARAGNLYLEYWEYYADSATFRGIPYLEKRGFHPDDWEGTTIRVNADGSVDQRASSHAGYNYRQGVANWGSDANIGLLRSAAEATGLRPHGGWGPAEGALFVSGGSHAGNATANLTNVGSYTPDSGIRLIPLEPIALWGDQTEFGDLTPPWLKDLWTDPEAEGTG